jgi:hypothetical protein
MTPIFCLFAWRQSKVLLLMCCLHVRFEGTSFRYLAGMKSPSFCHNPYVYRAAHSHVLVACSIVAPQVMRTCSPLQGTHSAAIILPVDVASRHAVNINMKYDALLQAREFASMTAYEIKLL